MTTIDEKIRQALHEDAEEKFISSGDDQALMASMLGTLRGRNKWWAVLVWFEALVFFVLAVLCGYQFFQASEFKDLIMWASATMLSMMAVAMLKMWMFMQMDKNSILREVKRLELQVARLSPGE